MPGMVKPAKNSNLENVQAQGEPATIQQQTVLKICLSTLSLTWLSVLMW